MRDGSCDLSLQSRLYREHLAPNEGAFLDLLLSVRESVDAAFLKKKAEAEAANALPRPAGEQDILCYPQGYCLEITNRVSRAVEENMPDYLRRFTEAWGVYEKKWGILETERQWTVFQNAIHVGTKIFDVANEEGAGHSGEKVAAYALNDPRYRNVKTFEEYAEIREKYQHFRAYSSFGLFGILAPFAVPVVFEREGGWVGYSDEVSTMELNVRTDFKAAKAFLSSSSYATHSLPEETAEGLRDCLRYVLEEDAEYDDPELSAYATGIRLMKQCFSFDAAPFSRANVRKGAKRWHWLKNRYAAHFVNEGYSKEEGTESLVLDFHRAFDAATSLYNALKHPGFRAAFEEAGYRGALIPIAARRGYGETFR